MHAHLQVLPLLVQYFWTPAVLWQYGASLVPVAKLGRGQMPWFPAAVQATAGLS